MQKDYTVVQHLARKELDISFIEYVLADEIYHLAFKTGWCFKSREKMAERIGVDRRSISRAINVLIEKGLVERNEDRVDLLRVTDKWYGSVIYDEKADGDKMSHDGTKSPTGRDNLSHSKGQNVPHKVTSKVKAKDSSTNVELVDHREQVSKLYYEVIKSLKLPVTNNNVVRSKITALSKEDTPERVIGYLKFMRDVYPILEFEYKPEMSEAIDIYRKRIQIENAVGRWKSEQSKPKKGVKRGMKL